MKCPSCGLYHPAFYERCVSCGVNLNPDTSEPSSQGEASPSPHPFSEIVDPGKQSISKVRFGHFQDDGPPIPVKKISPLQPKISKQKKIPTFVGIFIAFMILLVFAGATVLLFSQSPGDSHFLELGKHQLSLGQYAFAVETLNKAVAKKPDDPEAYLALARAYIGVDQVDQAWNCIVHAQQLGMGVVADPELTSQLANYYRQKGQYERAVDLLRPLANASLPGKRAELADMDAFRGDEAIEKGNLEQAKRSWEEVRDIKEGSRYPEAASRLATIYGRLADSAYNHNEDDKALDYLSKLNEIGENTRNYFLAAEIYEREDKLTEAIDQMNKCLKLAPDDAAAKGRLAQLLSKRGKELIGSGDGQTGYSYLEQANTVDPSIKIPLVTLKNVICKIDHTNKKPIFSGEIWNSTNEIVEALNMRIELCDLSDQKVLWSKNDRVIDEFVAPLPAKEIKSFSYSPSVSYSSKQADLLGFKVYLDGNFYQTYPVNPQRLIDSKKIVEETKTVDQEEQSQPAETKEYSLYQKPKKKIELPPPQQPELPKNISEPENVPVNQPAKEIVSPEEKTLKDLEY